MQATFMNVMCMQKAHSHLRFRHRYKANIVSKVKTGIQFKFAKGLISSMDNDASCYLTARLNFQIILHFLPVRLTFIYENYIILIK